jgi:hypothetical protein
MSRNGWRLDGGNGVWSKLRLMFGSSAFPPSQPQTAFSEPPAGSRAVIRAQLQESRQPGHAAATPFPGVLDADRDGVLSASEIANAPSALRKLDKNHDGKLSLEECGYAVLAALDTDHNGEISASEIRNAPEALKSLDKNADGKLTADDLFAGAVASK